jgi:hypothetical protein
MSSDEKVRERAKKEQLSMQARLWGVDHPLKTLGSVAHYVADSIFIRQMT